MTDEERIPGPIEGTVKGKPEGDLEIVDSIGCKVEVNGKLREMVIRRFENKDQSLENYGVAFRKDDPLGPNEEIFSVLKTLYYLLKTSDLDEQ